MMFYLRCAADHMTFSQRPHRRSRGACFFLAGLPPPPVLLERLFLFSLPWWSEPWSASCAFDLHSRPQSEHL